MTDWVARVADDADPLRRILRAARTWGRPPSVVLGRRIRTTYEHNAAGIVCASTTDEWTQTDTDLMLALEDYEASLCPGCQHPLDETSKDEHRWAYRPEPPIRCHRCVAMATNAEVVSKKPAEQTSGLLYHFVLDTDVVELNKQPVPPLPPDLGG